MAGGGSGGKKDGSGGNSGGSNNRPRMQDNTDYSGYMGDGSDGENNTPPPSDTDSSSGTPPVRTTDTPEIDPSVAAGAGAAAGLGAAAAAEGDSERGSGGSNENSNSQNLDSGNSSSGNGSRSSNEAIAAQRARERLASQQSASGSGGTQGNSANKKLTGKKGTLNGMKKLGGAALKTGGKIAKRTLRLAGGAAFAATAAGMALALGGDTKDILGAAAGGFYVGDKASSAVLNTGKGLKNVKNATVNAVGSIKDTYREGAYGESASKAKAKREFKQNEANREMIKENFKKENGSNLGKGEINERLEQASRFYAEGINSDEGLINAMKLEDKINADNNNYIMRMTCEVNSQQLTKATFDYLSNLTESIGGEPLKLEDIPPLKNVTWTASRIHDSGWIIYSILTKEVSAEGHTNVEETIIEIQ